MARPERDGETSPDEPDVLAVALVVYFAGLIVLVAGMLVLPALL